MYVDSDLERPELKPWAFRDTKRLALLFYGPVASGNEIVFMRLAGAPSWRRIRNMQVYMRDMAMQIWVDCGWSDHAPVARGPRRSFP